MNNIELPTKKNEKSTTPHVFDSSLSSQEKYRTFNEEVNQPHLRMKKKFDLTEDTLEAEALRIFKSKLTNRGIPKFVSNLKAGTVFFCVLIVAIAGVHVYKKAAEVNSLELGINTVGVFNNRTITISSIGALLLEISNNNSTDYQNRTMLLDQFSKQLKVLEQTQKLLNSTQNQLAMIPILEKTEVELRSKEYEPLDLPKNKISLCYLVDLFLLQGALLVQRGHDPASSTEFKNRVEFLTKIANEPLYQGSSLIAKEFYLEYRAKDQGFRVLFRILIVSFFLVTVLWNVSAAGTLYFLKNSNKKFLRMFDGYLKISREQLYRERASEIEDESLSTAAQDLSSNTSRANLREPINANTPRSEVAMSAQSILNSIKFKVSIRKTVRRGALIILIYVALFSYMTYREETFLDTIDTALSHRYHLENRAAAIQNLNNVAMYVSLLNQDVQYEGHSLKNKSIQYIKDIEKSLEETAKELDKSSTFTSYLSTFNNYNTYDVCSLLAKTDVEKHHCVDAHQGELVSGLKHTIQVLNNTILSNLAGDKADFTQRSNVIRYVRRADEVLDSKLRKDTISEVKYSYEMEYGKLIAITILTLTVVFYWFKNYQLATDDVWTTKDILNKVSLEEIRENENLFEMIRQKDFLEELE